jgi:protein kinase A
LNGPQEVKEHVWFKNYPWDDLLNKKITSPFIPPKADNFDEKYT